MDVYDITIDTINKINNLHCSYGRNKFIQITNFKGDIKMIHQAFPAHSICTTNDVIKKYGHVNEVLQKYPNLKSDSDIFFNNYGNVSNLLKYFPEILNPYVGHKIIMVDFNIKLK